MADGLRATPDVNGIGTFLTLGGLTLSDFDEPNMPMKPFFFASGASEPTMDAAGLSRSSIGLECAVEVMAGVVRACERGRRREWRRRAGLRGELKDEGKRER